MSNLMNFPKVSDIVELIEDQVEYILKLGYLTFYLSVVGIAK